jgi:hypothetical protein
MAKASVKQSSPNAAAAATTPTVSGAAKRAAERMSGKKPKADKSSLGKAAGKKAKASSQPTAISVRELKEMLAARFSLHANVLFGAQAVRPTHASFRFVCCRNSPMHPWTKSMRMASASLPPLHPHTTVSCANKTHHQVELNTLGILIIFILYTRDVNIAFVDN